MSFWSKVFGDPNDRYIKKLWPIVEQVKMLQQTKFAKYTDQQLQAMTEEFKKRFNDGEKLDDFIDLADDICGIGEYITSAQEADVHLFI